MGVPWFQLKTEISGAGHHVLEQLRALCIDVEQGYVHLEELAPRVEQYSIDEMFLDIRGIDSCIDLRTSAGSCASTCAPVRADNRRRDGADQNAG
jgi:DNA polymerase V